MFSSFLNLLKSTLALKRISHTDIISTLAVKLIQTTSIYNIGYTCLVQYINLSINLVVVFSIIP